VRAVVSAELRAASAGAARLPPRQHAAPLSRLPHVLPVSDLYFLSLTYKLRGSFFTVDCSFCSLCLADSLLLP
jgi:hypothetical protein